MRFDSATAAIVNGDLRQNEESEKRVV